MTKRFTEIEIWGEDWFLALPSEYMLFWFYLKDSCNHAGIWKPNKVVFEKMTGVKIDLSKAVDFFNEDKIRVMILDNGRWFIIQFIPFQYGKQLNLANRVHQSVYNQLKENGVSMTSIRPLIEVNQGVKDKDTSQDQETGGGVPRGGDRPESAKRRSPPNNNKKPDRLESAKRQPGEEKILFLEFVKLTQKEHQKLVDDLGLAQTNRYIDRLNGYIGQIGPKAAAVKYKSHYFTIRNWYNRDKSDGKITYQPESEAASRYELIRKSKR